MLLDENEAPLISTSHRRRFSSTWRMCFSHFLDLTFEYAVCVIATRTRKTVFIRIESMVTHSTADSVHLFALWNLFRVTGLRVFCVGNSSETDGGVHRRERCDPGQENRG